MIFFLREKDFGKGNFLAGDQKRKNEEEGDGIAHLTASELVFVS